MIWLNKETKPTFINVKIVNCFEILKKESKSRGTLIKKYKTPARIAKWTDEDIRLVHNVSRKISTSTLLEIKQSAIDSIGIAPKYLLDEIPSILNVYETVNDEVSSLEEKIKSIIFELDPPTLSIPGMGPISCATILGEFGDLSRFPSAEQCIAYAGVDVGISQSGTKCHRGKMVKRGSSHLRYALMNVVRTVCIHTPTFKNY